MKKIYITPCTVLHQVDIENMIAASLAVSDEVVNETEGDVKDAGDWDIWDE